jgi:hypothetical protein
MGRQTRVYYECSCYYEHMQTKRRRPRVPEDKFLLQVFVDRDLHKAFKIRCLERDTTMAEQIERLIQDYLKVRGA